MADFQDPLVCIVLVNWNGWPDTLGCLSSLEALRYPRFEIVLIDNGSDDDSVERIQAEYPALTLLQKDHNTGFTGGHNAGIAFALNHGAEYILLLNNDTVVDPDFLTHMVAAARADGRIGGLTPKIYFLEPRDEKVLWSAGGEVALWLARSGNRGRGQRDAGQYDALHETDYAPGCCVLMSRTAVETVGLLDDAYFAYFEDTDWSLRARAGGFKDHGCASGRNLARGRGIKQQRDREGGKAKPLCALSGRAQPALVHPRPRELGAKANRLSGLFPAADGLLHGCVCAPPPLGKAPVSMARLSRWAAAQAGA